MTQNIQPDAKLNSWNLFLLGFVNEKTRKAILLNTKTKEELLAKVFINQNNQETTYTVIEAVDEKTNRLIEFAKVFKAVNIR